MTTFPGFEELILSDGHHFYVGNLPPELVPDTRQFEALWAMHPKEYHQIRIHGRFVPTPRWQQAYGMDYHYTGRINKADPLPPSLAPLLKWVKQAVDPRLNGILVNWYDGSLGHYIGRHRDSTINLVVDAPIVTVSFGEERVFRLRPWRKNEESGLDDFRALNGTVFILPFETNLAWTHEVPKFRNRQGLRISVTFRAFESAQPTAHR